MESKKQNKQANRNRHTNTEDELVVARGRVGRMGETGEGDNEVLNSSYKINKSQE